jgi:hypothetical protein
MQSFPPIKSWGQPSAFADSCARPTLEYSQMKHLLVTRRYLDVIKVNRWRFVCSFGSVLGSRSTLNH